LSKTLRTTRASISEFREICNSFSLLIDWIFLKRKPKVPGRRITQDAFKSLQTASARTSSKGISDVKTW